MTGEIELIEVTEVIAYVVGTKIKADALWIRGFTVW